MRLTIDSNEPLEQVLEVVGSLYGVRLAVTGEGDALASSAPRARKHGNAARATRKKAASSAGGQRARAGTRSSKLDTAAVRGWARNNGHVVSDRGRLPGAVVAAYMSRKRTRAR